MRIAIVSQYFRPEPAKIVGGVAHGLADRGHSVRVVTGYPNYPVGRIYDGYRMQLASYEQHGHVEVRRVPLIPDHSNRPIRRIANYVSFALTSLLGRRFIRDADVIYVYATQMTAAFAPNLWRRFGGPPFVLHVQDLWPDSVTGSSLLAAGPVKRGVNAVLNRWISGVYRRASGVIAISPSMATVLTDRGVDPAKVESVLNWSADEEAPSLPRKATRPGVTVTFAGNVGDLQGLDVAVEAAKQVSKDIPGFRLLIVGDGVARESLVAAAHGSPAVEFRDRIPRDRMPEIYAETDFLFISLRDLPHLRCTVPSKLQSSFATAMPVIAAVAGESARIVGDAGAGFVAEPGDAAALVDAFRAAAQTSPDERAAMGARAREAYLTTMSMAQGLDQIEAILARCARPSRRPRTRNV